MSWLRRKIEDAFLPPELSRWRRIWERRPEVAIMGLAKKLGRTKFQVWIITSILATAMLYLERISPEIWAGLVGATGGIYQIVEGWADARSRSPGGPDK